MQQVTDKIKAPEMVLEILKETNRPMSPSQIKAKYKLNFPFTVKRVVAIVVHRPCPHRVTGRIGELITFDGRINSTGGFVYADVFNCFSWPPDNIIGFGILHDSERFVYYDGGVNG